MEHPVYIYICIYNILSFTHYRWNNSKVTLLSLLNTELFGFLFSTRSFFKIEFLFLFFFFNIFLSSLSILYDTWEIRNSVYSTFFILFGIEFLCMHRTNDTTQFQVTRRSHGHPYCRANNNNKLTIATCNLRIIRRG